ncbi:epidermal differentiation-specific protein-like [Pygocentrus nattereri]|uniref:epidermal differentiation-specific protein-like n=1 Tax=Pygocentrus nattereri TaxID=42514 RepID=UPI0018918E93|nr:epidermal differentiation-specific protein-like [Pygocentrus nattereri]
MNKIIVYEHVDFRGLSKEFTSDVSNLIDHNFNDCVSSLKVIGNPWVAYRDVHFSGPQSVFEEGEYARLENHENDTFSSLQLVTEDLSNPQITLYEHVNYQGRSLVINCETNLCSHSFNDITSSHKVQRGAWVLYEHANQTGRIMVARAHRDVPVYGPFNDLLTYLRPLKPGKPKVTVVLLWDKKQEETRSVTIDSICGHNATDQRQIFCPDLYRMYEVFTTERFNFCNAEEIRNGTKFDVDLIKLKTVYDFPVQETFTVQKGSSNTRTTKKSMQVPLPASVPPHSKITVNVLAKEVEVKIPVNLTITNSFNKTQLIGGEYICHSKLPVRTVYMEEPI